MRKNVILIDDDVDIRELVGFFLEQAGFVVCAVKDAFSALEELSRNHFDLIILDITMPHVNGFQLLKSIRAHESFKKLPVIMLTGRDEKSALVRVKDDVSDYVIKPPQRMDLLARIERILGGRPQFEEVQFGNHDDVASGSFGLPIQLISLSNNGMVLFSPIQVNKDFVIESLNIPTIQNLHLKQASFRVMDCTPCDQGFQYFISFFGMNPEDQKKIREWIMNRRFKEKSRVTI